MNIGSPEEAMSVVRKYITGTRSRHGKITSIVIDDEVKGPDDKGMWAMNGTYVTQEGVKDRFAASVSSKGEVRITIVESDDPRAKRFSPFRRR